MRIEAADPVSVEERHNNITTFNFLFLPLNLLLGDRLHSDTVPSCLTIIYINYLYMQTCSEVATLDWLKKKYTEFLAKMIIDGQK